MKNKIFNIKSLTTKYENDPTNKNLDKNMCIEYVRVYIIMNYELQLLLRRNLLYICIL